MILSHKHKFLFIHIGKTAGDSITHVLKPFCDENDIIVENKSLHPLLHKHAKAYELQDVFSENNWNWNDYYKFTVIRNPFEIIHSDYHYHKALGFTLFPDRKPPAETTENYEWVLKCYNTANQTFEDYVEQNYGYWNKGFLRIWCMSRIGIVNLDNIYQQRTLGQDFDKICDNIGIERLPLIIANTTAEVGGRARPPLQQDYTPKLISFVKKTFAEDLAVFNYTLEDAI